MNDWPEKCGDPRCRGEEVEVAILSKSGKSPDMFFCRAHAIEFMAAISLSIQTDIVMNGLKAMRK